MRGFGGEGLGIRVESLGFRKVYCFQEEASWLSAVGGSGFRIWTLGGSTLGLGAEGSLRVSFGFRV